LLGQRRLVREIDVLGWLIAGPRFLHCLVNRKLRTALLLFFLTPAPLDLSFYLHLADVILLGLFLYFVPGR